MIKLVAIDMDDTCLNDKKKISKQTLEALSHLKKQGILFIPTTGRALDCLPHQLNPSLFHYVISSNGANVLNCETKEVIYQCEIDKPTSLALLSQIPSHIGITSHIQHHYLIQGKILVLFGRFVYGKDGKKVISIPDMKQIVQKSKKEVEEFQFYFFNDKQEQQLRQILSQMDQLTYAFGKNYVEVFALGASKGKALQVLAHSLGIKQDEIACIGDGENDLSMFEVSGLKLAMGNACDALKKKADIILPTNNQDGVAYAIENYILKS